MTVDVNRALFGPQGSEVLETAIPLSGASKSTKKCRFAPLLPIRAPAPVIQEEREMHHPVPALNPKMPFRGLRLGAAASSFVTPRAAR